MCAGECRNARSLACGERVCADRAGMLGGRDGGRTTGDGGGALLVTGTGGLCGAGTLNDGGCLGGLIGGGFGLGAGPVIGGPPLETGIRYPVKPLPG